MTDDLHIRLVRSEDCGALIQFLEENDRPEVTRYFNPFPLDRATAQRICLNGQLDRYIVALLKGRIVGLSMLRGWNEGFEVPSFGILIDRSNTQHGIGRRLMEFTLTEARKKGCRSVRLSVHASNKRAVSLYSSLGFVELTREPVRVSGEPDVKIVMTKALERDDA